MCITWNNTKVFWCCLLCLTLLLLLSKYCMNFRNNKCVSLHRYRYLDCEVLLKVQNIDICLLSHHNNILPSIIMVQLHVQTQNVGIWTIDQMYYVIVFWFFLLSYSYWCCKGLSLNSDFVGCCTEGIRLSYERDKCFCCRLSLLLDFSAPPLPANTVLPSTHSHMTLLQQCILLHRVVE